MSHRLSKAQQTALERLDEKGWRTAYEIRCSLNTLESLVSKGMVEKRVLPGFMAFPRNCIEFRKTGG